MPIGVYDRDLVQYITHRRDEDKKLDYILYKNATDDRRPEQPGLVRSEDTYTIVIVSSCMGESKELPRDKAQLHPRTRI